MRFRIIMILKDLFREAFGLPDDENPLGEVHAVLMLSGQDEAFVRSLLLPFPFPSCR